MEKSPIIQVYSDATIISHELMNPEGAMRAYFRLGDVFILDRGFRDAVPELLQNGYHAHIPFRRRASAYNGASK